MAAKSNRRLKVGVLFGGRSSEHEISLRSALTVISAIDPRRYEVVPIGIGQDGRWYLQNGGIKTLERAARRLEPLKRRGPVVSLPPFPGSQSLIPIDSTGRRGGKPSRGKSVHFPGRLDVIFPLVHGTNGEDGTIQGLLELAEIPYVGSGVLGSAVGMDKDVQKRLLRDAGLPVVRYSALTHTAHRADPKLASSYAAEIGYPLFVKPCSLGSSVGVSRVGKPQELARALRDAFQYDRKVLIEAACEGREIECAVLGNDAPEASVPGEIVVARRHRFYSYESKYLDPRGAETRIPADLPPAIRERIRTLAVDAFKVLDLRGMARIDFLAPADLAEIYISEANSIPGFTSISMYPKLWEASGLSLAELVDRLLSLALEEGRERAALTRHYRSRPNSSN
jgi:D-alanine-D-alanine ligase